MDSRRTLTHDDGQLFDKDADRLMSTVSAAKYLDVKPQTIRKWVSEGRLKPSARLRTRAGGTAGLLRFRLSDLDAMLTDA